MNYFVKKILQIIIHLIILIYYLLFNKLKYNLNYSNQVIFYIFYVIWFITISFIFNCIKIFFNSNSSFLVIYYSLEFKNNYKLSNLET